MTRRNILLIPAAYLSLALLAACARVQSQPQPQAISCCETSETPETVEPAAGQQKETFTENAGASSRIARNLRPLEHVIGAAPREDTLPVETPVYMPGTGAAQAASDVAPSEICALPADNRAFMPLTPEEAMADEAFGSFFPSAAPSGFEAEAISRYKDSLTGLWTSIYRELHWTVRAFADTDASRLTAASDTQNYDLTRYPIPRAESVPAELREIVDNPIFYADELTQAVVDARTYEGDEGYDCFCFSVKYGGILVTVRAKGVEPAWVCQQLTAINDTLQEPAAHN